MWLTLLELKIKINNIVSDKFELNTAMVYA